MAPHSSTLAWKIPWTEEPGGLQTMGSRRVGHNWATSLSLFPFMHWRRKWQLIPVFLPGDSQGRGSLVGHRLWGWLHRVGDDWSDLTVAAYTNGSDGKESAHKAGYPSSVPGLGRSPGEEHGNQFQYSCLEYSMDRGAWWATVHGLQTVRHN